MQSRIHIIGAFLFLAGCASLPPSTFPNEPRCPSIGTKQVWEKNFNGCMKPFRSGAGVAMDLVEVEASCRCIANGIVNAPTCSELEAYASGNRQYRDQFLQKVVDACKDKISALKGKSISVEP